MSDFTTPESCDSSVTAQSPAAIPARELPLANSMSPLIVVYGLWIAVAVLYWPSTVRINALWTQPLHYEPLTHGYLVLLISLWLTFRERKRLAAAPIRPVPFALLPLAVLSACWVWSWRADIQEAHVMLLPLLLFSAIVAVLGWRAARLAAFPIGYLYFAMPMWTDFYGPVQTLSAKVTGILVWITGLPAYVQGDYVHLPAGTVEIARTCSGLHALIVGLALATLYGELSHEPLRRRVTWIGVMASLSLIENWVRIFVVLVAAYLSDMHSSLVRNHYWLGWWLFAAFFAGFLWWTGRQPAAVDQANRSDQRSEGTASSAGSSLNITGMTLTVAVLAVLPVIAYGMDWAHASDAGKINIQWPAAPSGWSGPQTAAGSVWHPTYIGAGGESLVKYIDPNGQLIEAFAVGYRVQTQNAKLLSYWNHLLGKKGALRSESVRIVNSPSGQWREALAIDRSGRRSLIWWRYRIGNRLFVRPRLAQLWYGLEALVNRPTSSLVALRTLCTPNCRAAGSRLGAEAADFQPTVR